MLRLPILRTRRLLLPQMLRLLILQMLRLPILRTRRLQIPRTLRLPTAPNPNNNPTGSPSKEPASEPPHLASCTDTPGFSDMYGDGCDYYKKDPYYPLFCLSYGGYGKYGRTPNENCCACKDISFGF